MHTAPQDSARSRIHRRHIEAAGPRASRSRSSRTSPVQPFAPRPQPSPGRARARIIASAVGDLCGPCAQRLSDHPRRRARNDPRSRASVVQLPIEALVTPGTRLIGEPPSRPLYFSGARSAAARTRRLDGCQLVVRDRAAVIGHRPSCGRVPQVTIGHDLRASQHDLLVSGRRPSYVGRGARNRPPSHTRRALGRQRPALQLGTKVVFVGRDAGAGRPRIEWLQTVPASTPRERAHRHAGTRSMPGMPPAVSDRAVDRPIFPLAVTGPATVAVDRIRMCSAALQKVVVASTCSNPPTCAGMAEGQRAEGAVGRVVASAA